jgi:RNA-directed DNA polymerase
MCRVLMSEVKHFCTSSRICTLCRRHWLAESKIEDCFGEEIKAVVINGKTFNVENEFDVGRHYGKKVFAHKVVVPRAETIDFSGFRQLLTNVTKAIQEHMAGVASRATGGL